MVFKEVESTVEPSVFEENAGTYYVRRNITEVEATDETPTMYVYEEAQATEVEYIQAQLDVNASNVQYLAMMTDIDLEE